MASLSEWRNRIMIPLGFGYLTAYIIIIASITASVGTNKALGSILYALGWLMVGHGMDMPGFRFNIVFAVLVLTLTFLVWYSLKKTLNWMHSPKSGDEAWSLLIWFLSLLFSFSFLLLFGYGLMWAGTEALNGQSNIPVNLLVWRTDDILDAWETSSIDWFIDFVLMIPLTVPLIWYGIKLSKAYGVIR